MVYWESSQRPTTGRQVLQYPGPQGGGAEVRKFSFAYDLIPVAFGRAKWKAIGESRCKPTQVCTLAHRGNCPTAACRPCGG